MTLHLHYQGQKYAHGASRDFRPAPYLSHARRLCCRVSQGINPEKIAEALKSHISPKGRMKFMAGIKDTLIIDDTYNSSPVAASMLHSTHLKDTKTAGRKIAYLAI
jgi:UDP-N-acetylmuramyl pentapeptide synthase